MRNKKRSIVLILVAAMILSSVSFAFADTTGTKFTDIDSSWAKQHIINVYNKGLMNGVTDTQFKPKDSVTHYQAFIAIARMTKAKEKYDLAALVEKYKNETFNIPDYAKQEIAYCLEAGITTPVELSVLSKTTIATKQVVSRYLAKALGASYDPNKAIVFLGFTDSEFIVKDNKPYIKHLIDLGVLSSEGDANGRFNPDSTVTREMFAKMLDIASDKYVNAPPTTPTEPTTPTTPIPPTDTTQPPSTGETTPPPTPVEAPDYTGKVEKVIIEYGVIVVNVNGANNTVVKKDFKIADDMKCIIDGVENSHYWKIKAEDRVSIYLNKQGKVEKLVVDSKIKKLTGTIESILITDKLELNIKLQTGEIRTYYITDKTKIIKNMSVVKYDYLKPGDNVAITVDDVNITDINADSTIVVDTGIIESIIYTRTAAPRITMFDYEGNKKEYFIREDLDSRNIIIEGRNASVYDLRPGMDVKVELENDEIVKLTTIRTETSDSFEGTIKYVNTTLKIITITQYDAEQQKEIEKKVYVENAAVRDISLNYISLSQLKAGAHITIFGTEDADKITATLVVVNK
ncbi:MAG: S-layer protein [Clostridia bacterium]|jgi:hypothetical protein|nr:S-layer protein [Clostridia bacterium]